MSIMRGDENYRLSIILILICAFVWCPFNADAQTNKRRGIDFVIEIEMNYPIGPNSVEETVEVIRTRLRALGAESEVQRSRESNNQIQVKVYGATDFAKFRGLFQNHTVEIRPLVSLANPKIYQSYMTLSEAQSKCKANQFVKQYNFRDREASHFIILEGETIVNGSNIRKARAVSRTGFDNDYQIQFFLTDVGSVYLSEWTEKNLNKYIAVILDDRVVSVSYVKGKFNDGEISGRFTRFEAESIASALQSGNFPGTVRIVSESRFE